MIITSGFNKALILASKGGFPASTLFAVPSNMVRMFLKRAVCALQPHSNFDGMDGNDFVFINPTITFVNEILPSDNTVVLIPCHYETILHLELNERLYSEDINNILNKSAEDSELDEYYDEKYDNYPWDRDYDEY